MKIRFNKTLDDFAAFQVFHAKHNKKKASASMILFAVLLLLILFCIIGENIYHQRYGLLSVVVLGVVVYYVFVVRNQKFESTMYYKQGEYLEKEGMRELTGENTIYYDDEQLYCESMDSVVKKSIGGIEKLVICPEYLFIYTDPISGHYISRAGIIEGNFDAFAAGLIEIYQSYAATHGAEANVIHSDWGFKAENLQKGLSFDGKVNRVRHVFIWAVIFGFPTSIATTLIFGLIMYLLLQQGVIEKGQPLPGYPVYILFGIPVIAGLVGAFLAFKGKLPMIKGPFSNE
jgi:fatty acid desaturase